jgi:hypothetical protein
MGKIDVGKMLYVSSTFSRFTSQPSKSPIIDTEKRSQTMKWQLRCLISRSRPIDAFLSKDNAITELPVGIVWPPQGDHFQIFQLIPLRDAHTGTMQLIDYFAF